MTGDGTAERQITTGARMLSVVEVLRAEGGAGVTAVADRLGVAKSTAHAHLQTLHDNRYVVKRDGEYYVSLRFLELGQAARQPWDEHTFIEKKVEELAAESQMRAQFLTAEHDEAVYVYRSTGRHSVPTDSRVGVRLPLHSVAAGKAMLAHFPQGRVDAVVERHGLPALTDRTITDREELAAALERIRDRGYAVNEGESWEGVQAVGAPVLAPDDRVVGGLSVSGSSHRVDPEAFGDLVMGAANELKLEFKYE
jgi:DNA-binding IclR family transcriptional regulator